MRILLFGKNGQLGWELQRTLACLGQITAVDFPDVDLSKKEQANKIIERYQPQIIINAAAYTAVDEAERDVDKAFAVNQAAPAAMAMAAKETGAAFIHYSTDYVFDGAKQEPYREDEPANPINIYGKSKLAGEEAVQDTGGDYLIFRTAWVYSLRGETFINKMLGWARKNAELRVVDDQVSNPTWARLLAEITAQVLVKLHIEKGADIGPRKGLYHLAGAGYASRYEWARQIIDLLPPHYPIAARKVVPAKSADFPTPAQRPPFSALDCGRFAETFGLALPHWRSALKLALDELR